MTTLVDELEALKTAYTPNEDMDRWSYDDFVSKQAALDEAIHIVKTFTADHADCIDAQPVVLIENLTGDN